MSYQKAVGGKLKFKGDSEGKKKKKRTIADSSESRGAVPTEAGLVGDDEEEEEELSIVVGTGRITSSGK
jgi:hypothetical protein